MNDGVALLLDRMKTRPEEFVDGGKWAHIMNKHKDFLAVEDQQALTNGLNKLMQQQFTEKVMEELIEPKQVITLKPKVGNPYFQQGVTLSSSAISETTTVNTPVAGVTQTL
jgi:hypothetical protein